MNCILCLIVKEQKQNGNVVDNEGGNAAPTAYIWLLWSLNFFCWDCTYQNIIGS